LLALCFSDDAFFAGEGLRALADAGLDFALLVEAFLARFVGGFLKDRLFFGLALLAVTLAGLREPLALATLPLLARAFRLAGERLLLSLVIQLLLKHPRRLTMN
jgi:hypothetical protein